MLLWILILALLVRGLTAYFIQQHLYDPGWFQFGTYAHFDRQAQDILERKASLFFVNDPTRTETAIYPPGYPLWIAFIYKVTGQRGPASALTVQWVLDAWSTLLIVVIAATVFGWRTGVIAGILAALSPLLALYGATPLADAPTSWLVCGGVLLLVFAANKGSPALALGAGLLAGASCWLRGNALLLPVFWASALFLLSISWKLKFTLAGAVLLGALAMILPLLVRNAIAFHAITPTGLGAGTNLWEGIGETDRAAEFGAVFGDRALLEQERDANGVAPNQPYGLYFPNGVQRDRERAQKAMKVIVGHPVWYSGVMLRRMAGTLKFAGKPGGFYGSAGINVTRKKVLPENLQHGPIAWFVTAVGMLQSVMRYFALPLMVLGLWFALSRDWRISLLLLSTVAYYLVVGSIMHTEIRYGLPMQALLFVFAGFAIDEIWRFVWKKPDRSISRPTKV